MPPPFKNPLFLHQKGLNLYFILLLGVLQYKPVQWEKNSIFVLAKIATVRAYALQASNGNL